MTGILFAASLPTTMQPLPAQAPSRATAAEPASTVKMSFDFANPALTPASYRIEFDGSGLGHYHSDPGSASPPDAHGASPETFDQQIQISPAVRDQLLALAGSAHLRAGDCESRHNKVAFTGQKTFTYSGPAGHAGCTFNWSQDAQLMKAANTCMAISLTLEEGRRLRLAYLHDRLSLDAELETLAASVKGGNALELQNIAPELEAIASDRAIMKRAQMRAAALLAIAPGAPGLSR